MGKPAEHALYVVVQPGFHHYTHHPKEVRHYIALAVPQGIVLEKIQANQEAIFQVFHPEYAGNGAVYHLGERGKFFSKKLFRNRGFHRIQQGGNHFFLHKIEPRDHLCRVAQAGVFVAAPPDDVHPLQYHFVAPGKDPSVQFQEQGRKLSVCTGFQHGVLQKAVPFKERNWIGFRLSRQRPEQ